jgi:hypothetical protein
MYRNYGFEMIRHLAVGNIFHAKENQKNKGNPPLIPPLLSRESLSEKKRNF